MAQPTVAEFVAESRDSGEPVRLRSDNRSECRAMAAASAHRLLLVDGRMWSSVEAREPAWEVIEASDNKVRLELTLSREPRAYVSVFRLDRLEEARAFASERGRALGREVIETIAKVTINDPTVLRRDEAVETARQMISHLHWSDGSAGRDEAVRDLVRLGESLTPEQAAEAHLLVQNGISAGTIRPSNGVGAAVSRFAGMIPGRPELASQGHDDEAFLAGLGL